MEEIKNLFKATRVERTIHIVAMMLIPVAFVDTLNYNLLILALCCVPLYSGFSIHNGIQDKDYPLPKYAKWVFISMVALSILISLYNWIIFAAVISWIIFGYIYNTISRKILLMDITVMTCTHIFIPVFTSGLLLGLQTKESFLLSTLAYIIFWFMGHNKNLNGWEEDKKRGYKTIATEFKNPKIIIRTFFILSLGLMFTTYYLFKLNISYLISFLIMLILCYFAFNTVDSGKIKLFLKISHSMAILFCVGLLCGKNSYFAFYSLIYFLISSISWIKSLFLLKINSGTMDS